MSNNESPTQGRPRRASVGNTVLTNLFQRGSSTSAVFPNTTANMSSMNDAQRRRLSISTSTLGLHGSPPTNPVPFGLRRGSMSAHSDSIDENAVDDDDSPSSSSRTAPNTPFTRHMSFGAQTMWYRGGGGSPGSDQQGFNWSEQLRNRAESSVSGARPSFSFASGLSSSPPRAGANQHDRQKSVSDMPAPPAQASKPKAPERQKPDPFQERILKGDFYMD